MLDVNKGPNRHEGLQKNIGNKVSSRDKNRLNLTNNKNPEDKQLS